MQNQFINMIRLAFGIVGAGLIYLNNQGRGAHAGDQNCSEDNEELAELLADCAKRRCALYLLIRPLEVKVLKSMTYFTSLQHWAIGIEFDHRFLICEYSGNLSELPYFTSYRNLKEYQRGSSDVQVKQLHSLTQSPHFFHELALEATKYFG